MNLQNVLYAFLITFCTGIIFGLCTTLEHDSAPSHVEGRDDELSTDSSCSNHQDVGQEKKSANDLSHTESREMGKDKYEQEKEYTDFRGKQETHFVDVKDGMSDLQEIFDNSHGIDDVSTSDDCTLNQGVDEGLGSKDCEPESESHSTADSVSSSKSDDEGWKKDYSVDKEESITGIEIEDEEGMTLAAFQTEKLKEDVDHGNSKDVLSEEGKGEDGQSAETEAQRQKRFSPLLFSFRTLFASVLAGFSNDAVTASISTSALNANTSTESIVTSNVTASELLDEDINATDSEKKARFQCAPKNISDNTSGEVKIVNSTELLEMLNFSKNEKISSCVLVMFYAPWCQFCARSAPHYNALARTYPQLDILAVDTTHFSYLNARFGTVAVPNVMLFHSRSAVRFNHTSRRLENFIAFVVNNTGIEPNVSVRLEPMDFLGPLSSTVVKAHDWLLWLAWAFVISCSTYGFVCSRYSQSIITRLTVLWQEHQHIE